MRIVFPPLQFFTRPARKAGQHPQPQIIVFARARTMPMQPTAFCSDSKQNKHPDRSRYDGPEVNGLGRRIFVPERLVSAMAAAWLSLRCNNCSHESPQTTRNILCPIGNSGSGLRGDRQGIVLAPAARATRRPAKLCAAELNQTFVTPLFAHARHLRRKVF